MKSVGNRGVVQSRLQILHIHVLFVAPLGTPLRSLAQTSIGVEFPSGNIPTTRGPRRIYRFVRSIILFVRMRAQCSLGRSSLGQAKSTILDRKKSPPPNQQKESTIFLPAKIFEEIRIEMVTSFRP